MGFLFVIIPVLLLAVGIAAFFAYLAEKKRRDELTELANGLGWSFQNIKNRNHRHQFPQFHCFKRGDQSRFAFNRLAGTWAADASDEPIRLECQAGDYRYQTVSKKPDGKRSTSTHRFSYLLVKLPFSTPATLNVRPENLGDRMSAFMGYDDIDFESAEFSKKYHVTSSDKRFAYDLIHPRMMEFLMRGQPVRFELASGWICLVSRSRRWRPEEFKQQLYWATEFVGNWPRHRRDD